MATLAGIPLTPAETRHYSRHILIPEVGVAGQQRLKQARVLVVGTGGLGAPAAMYLAAAGIGTLGLVEFDEVDASNLHRQILYTVDDIGAPKLERAMTRLSAMNPHIRVVGHSMRLDASNALDVIRDYDVVVDGTDNFATRYLINDACVLLDKPNVHASIFRFEGMHSVFHHQDGPCYRCLYPEPPPSAFAPSCAEGGVFGALPGIMGSLQAAETIRLLLGLGDTMAGRLLRFDGLRMRFEEYRVRRNPDCVVCGDHPTQQSLIDYPAFCAGNDPRDADAVEPPSITAMALKRRLDAGERVQLVDVRSQAEHDIVRIAGSRLIPVDDLEFAVDELDRTKCVVCYCKMGLRSLRAARWLLDHEFTDVATLEGGIVAWMREVENDAPVY